MLELLLVAIWKDNLFTVLYFLVYFYTNVAYLILTLPTCSMVFIAVVTSVFTV